MASRLTRLIKEIAVINAGEHCTFDELVRVTGKSRRTLFRDFNTLKDCGLKLERDARSGKYFFKTPRHLPDMDLTLVEWIAIFVAMKKVREEQNTPLFSMLPDTMAKLINYLPPAKKNYIQTILSSIGIPEAVNPTLEVDNTIMKRFFFAIGQNKYIQIEFVDIETNEIHSMVLRPTGLVFRNSAWFVEGIQAESSRGISLPINQIRSAEDRIDPEARTTVQQINAGFQMVEKLTANKLYIVKLLFKPEIAREVCRTKWHQSQSVQANDDGSIQMKMILNEIDSIIPWILGFGENVEIVAPQELKEKVVQIASQVVQQYN